MWAGAPWGLEPRYPMTGSGLGPYNLGFLYPAQTKEPVVLFTPLTVLAVAPAS